MKLVRGMPLSTRSTYLESASVLILSVGNPILLDLRADDFDAIHLEVLKDVLQKIVISWHIDCT